MEPQQTNSTNPIEATPQPSVVSISRFRFWLILAAVIVGTSALAGGVVYGMMGAKIGAERKMFEQRISILQSQSSQSKSTADWKSYQDKKIGVDFKYPSTWNLSTTYRENTTVIIKNSTIDVSAKDNAVVMIINGFWEHGFMGLTLGETKNITIDGVTSKFSQFRDNDNGKIGLVIVRIDHPKREYGVEFHPSDNENQDDLMVFDQILSTFKFTDPAPVSTADWKTYRNDNLNFTFEYPSILGDVKFSIRKGGDSGSAFVGAFTKNNKLSFGGISSDFEEGRGGYFLDAQGYEVKGNQYFAKFVKQSKIEITKEMAVKEISSPVGNILILTGITGMYGPGEKNYGALINLNDSVYPGMAFQDNDTDNFSLQTFERILSSFKFLK